MGKLRDIQGLAGAHAKARALLSKRVGHLRADMDTLRGRRLPGIKRALEEVRRSNDELRLAIEGAREKFRRPRSRTFHDIRLGLKKAKGSMRWASDERVVELIKQHMPDQVEVLVKRTEKPVKTALQQLSAADLKKLGVSIVGAGDEVFIKPSDSDLDKLIVALLSDESDEDAA